MVNGLKTGILEKHKALQLYPAGINQPALLLNLLISVSCYFVSVQIYNSLDWWQLTRNVENLKRFSLCRQLIATLSVTFP